MSVQTRVAFELALYGSVIGGGLILLGLLSVAGAGYVATNPPVEEIPAEEVDVQTFDTSVSHAAVVDQQTPLYESGEELRDMPVYFTNVTPDLTVTITTTGPADRSLDVTHRLVLRHAATFDDAEFWSREEVLVADEARVEGGEHITNVTIDVPAVQSEIESFEEAIAGVGDVSTELQLETTYQTDAEGGGTYEGTLSATAPLEVGDSAYWIDGGLDDSATERQQTEATTREQSPDLVLVGILGVLGIIGIGSGAGLLVWRSRRVDLRALENAVVRSRYDEWISTGEFPVGTRNQYIFITSLEDLVDVGIDSNKRVIYDPDLEAYSVADGDLIYYHAADPTNLNSWLSLSSVDD